MGFLHILTGSRPEIAIAYCREASALAEAGGFDVIRASADACLAQVYVCTGAFWEAVTAGERALTIFEQHGHLWWACRTLWHLSTAANAMGEWERSLQYCRRALEYGQSLDNLRLKVVGWWRTGSTHIQLGDPERGLQCCAEALALAPEPYDAAYIQAVRGYGLAKAGQMDTGTAELTAAVAWFEQSRLCYPHALFTLWLGEVYLRQGEREKARRLCEVGLAASQQAGYCHLTGVAKRLLGESLMTEEPEAAAVHVAEAVHILWELGARNEVAKAWVAQATLRQATGVAAGAQQLLTQALDLFAALRTCDEPCRVRAVLATLQDQW
jgi:tetratricopeptide (TPR) repeat protein